VWESIIIELSKPLAGIMIPLEETTHWVKYRSGGFAPEMLKNQPDVVEQAAQFLHRVQLKRKRLSSEFILLSKNC